MSTTLFDMSDLQRKWAKAKVNATADANPLMEDVEDEELSELPDFDDDGSSSASSASSTGTVIPSPRQNLFARPQGLPRGRNLDQIPWTTYFERELFLKPHGGPEGTIHHAYLTSPVGNGPLFVTHHGAGSSGLSFAVLSSEIRKRIPTAGVLSPDCRGHGSTSVPGADLELNLTTLSSDLATIIQLTKIQMSWRDLPSIILIGHSLGGAVVTDLAKRGDFDSKLLGYAVLDVVEGSAIDALQSMQRYLSTRPTGFATVKEGIDWHVRSRTIRNSVSARTSVPALLEFHEDKDGTRENTGKSRPWRWRTDLGATQPFWEGWFVGLSKKFLEAKSGKLLILAGTDRLDTELTIGQMQGKYSLQIFTEAGHFIHEDLPEKTATVLLDFYRRNDRSALLLPPKVSELLAQGRKV